MAVSSGPFCGALGCTDEADVVVENRNGTRYVCDEHASGEVVGDV